MKKSIKIGGQFSGVGAFDLALDRYGIKYENIYQAEWDKYARQTYLHNHSKPKWYVEDVNDTPIHDIPTLDIAMFSPPCQAFSLAGKRKGEDDKRGILFYNSHEFIKVNKPRYFIFENVKGLMSDAKGRTFQIWLDMLGGKSVNGNPVIFPHDDAVPYHIYHRVLNAKDYNIPQNRERVFIVGIRDDADNNFRWPVEIPLSRKLKHVLEPKVDSKYYLSDNAVNRICYNDSGFKSEPKTSECIASTVCASDYKLARGMNVFKERLTIGAMRVRNPENPNSRLTGDHYEQRLEINSQGISNTLSTVQKDNVVVYGNLKGGKWDRTHEQSGRVYDTNGLSPTIHTMGGGNQEPKIFNEYAIRKLTPRECFRLMDFPDTFTWPVSDSQAYKQAGNSICVGVLAAIIKKLNLCTNKK